MPSVWNNGDLSISIFGESHGKGIGVVLDGMKAGVKFDLSALRSFMARRAPGKTPYSTPRRESDLPEILSGIVDDTSCGTPIAAVIRNQDTRSQDYQKTSSLARPGHADYTGHIRYQGYNDPRGGGHFSGRLTAPLVFAGGLCLQFLSQSGVTIGAHIASIGGIPDSPFDQINPTKEDLLLPGTKAFPVLNDEQGHQMQERIEAARMDCDSIGGIVECCVIGLPAGLGSPMFGGVENLLSSIIFGIPAVKGISFGIGFEAANLLGSQCNDAFYMDGDIVKTRTNNHGGILGGISSGMPLCFQVAFKPTPSIAKTQDTVDLTTGSDAKLEVQGRHDPCIVPRAVPCVEAAAAIALTSLFPLH